MPEQTVKISIPDTEFNVHAVQRGNLSRPVIIILHGRPGHANEALPFLAARKFDEAGYDSLRLSLYGFSKDQRNLVDCTIDTHAADLGAVVDYLKEKTDSKIFVVGHSYGGLTVIRSQKRDFDAAVLWDPTHGEVYHVDFEDYGVDFDKHHINDLGIYVELSGQGSVVGEHMHEEDQALGDNSSDAEGFQPPLKIVSAGKGPLKEFSKKYLDYADGPTEQAVIEKASHTFDDSDEVVARLFEETIKWFNQYS